MDINGKNNTTEGWTLNSFVIGSFLLLFAVLVSLFAGTIGFAVSMPFLMVYLSRFFQKMFVITFALAMLSLIIFFCKKLFEYSNWDIFFLVSSLCLLSFILNRMKKGHPSIRKRRTF
ncbi:hypothetical protein EB001_05730 [bacterium]|nr:hypothetical protein [bacterium]